MIVMHLLTKTKTKKRKIIFKNMKKRKLHDGAIRNTVKYLSETLGSTTEREVCAILEKLNFNFLPRDVGAFLRKEFLQPKTDFHRSYNDDTTDFVYSLKSNPYEVDNSPSLDILNKSGKSDAITGKSKHIGEAKFKKYVILKPLLHNADDTPIESLKKLDNQHWVVTHASNRHKNIMILHKDESNDHVRTYYSTTHKVKNSDVRCVRLKHHLKNIVGL
jgi:hypothetical protein